MIPPDARPRQASVDDPRLSSAESSEPRRWERICAALVLAGAAATAAAIVVMAAMNPSYFAASVATGRLPWYSFLLPVLFVSAAILLVRMSRWSYPLLALHLTLAFGYSAYMHGAAVLSSMSMVGFGLEGLAVVFSSYLGRTGKLH